MRIRTSLALLATHALSAMAQSSNSSAIYQLSTNGQFAFTLEIALALANGGGAATGEVLRAASQIVPGDFESYYREFRFLANAIHAAGNASSTPSARRDAFFRAASYYRHADFYLHGNASDPRIDELWANQTANFDAAIALLDSPGKRVNVTSEEGGFNVSLIVYTPGPEHARNGARDAHNKKKKGCGRPTLLVGTGYDASQEDLYHGLGRHALDRGWNFVTYEGPGQPTVRRQQGLGFRPDWWNVVTPAVDYLLSRADVDGSRVALVGESFGGLLAPIAASREHRLAAVVAIDGMYKMQDVLREKFPAALMAIFDAGKKDVFDEVVNAARRNETVSSTFRWIVDQGLWAFNTESPFEWFAQLGNFSLEGLIANITAPVFLGSGEDDYSTSGQAEKAAAAFGSQGYYHQFKTDVGAGEHCQIGAEQQLAQIAFDWVESIFEDVGKSKNSSTSH